MEDTIRQVVHTKRVLAHNDIRKRQIKDKLAKHRTVLAGPQTSPLIEEFAKARAETGLLPQYLSQLASKSFNQPSQKLVVLGPPLINLLKSQPSLTLESINSALQVINNVTAIEGVKQQVVESWPLEQLISVLLTVVQDPAHIFLSEVAFFALSNIIAMSSQLGRRVDLKALAQIENVVMPLLNESQLSALGYLLDTLFSEVAVLQIKYAESLVRLFLALLKTENNEIQYLFMKSMAVVNCLEENNPIGQLLYRMGCLQALAYFAKRKGAMQVRFCLEVFTYYSRGKIEHTDYCIETGCIAALKHVLNSINSKLVAKALATLSNFLLTGPSHTATIADEQLIEQLGTLFEKGGEDIRVEVLYNYLSILKTGCQKQLLGMYRAFTQCCEGLRSEHGVMVLKGLECLQLFLNLERESPEWRVKQALVEKSLDRRIEDLQNNKSYEIYRKAYSIVQHFFS